MHPVNYLFDEINRELWGIPARKNGERQERFEVPVRPRFSALQRLPLGALKRS